MKFKQIQIIRGKYSDEFGHNYHHRIYALTEDGDIVYNDVQGGGKNNLPENPVSSLWYKLLSPSEWANQEEVDEYNKVEFSDFS